VPFSDAEVEAAVRRLEEPGALDAAQRTAAAQAPALQRILNQALEDADWFGSAHADEIRKATQAEDVETAVRTLIAEETRVAMLIGAAVGLELANQLRKDTH
jgi:hypothetical protein